MCRFQLNKTSRVRDQQRNYAGYVEQALLGDIDDRFDVAAASCILGSDDFVDAFRRGLTRMSGKINVMRAFKLIARTANVDTISAALSAPGGVASLGTGLRVCPLVRALPGTEMPHRTGINISATRYKRIQSWIDFDHIVDALSRLYDVEREELLSRYKRGNEARQMLILLSAKHCRGRYSLTELSEKLDLSLGDYTSRVYNLPKRLQHDPEFRRLGRKMEKKLIENIK